MDHRLDLAHRPMRIIAVVAILFGLLGPLGAVGNAQISGSVYVIEIMGEIDLGLPPYVRRVIREAEGANASAVVLEINTPGGRLDAALDIKNALLEAEVPTIAFINREAFSAGAMIAIAAERIYMTPGAVIGAATPIVGDTGAKASEKVVSAVRTAFRSIAEARGRDPDVAEAMVDESVSVAGLVEEGKLLTLTTVDALAWGYADGEVADFEAVLTEVGLSGNPVVETTPGIAERLVRFITNPAVSSLLISLGFLGLFFELQSPGIGLAGAVGVICIALFFWGHFLAGLAGMEGIVLVVSGVVLLIVEMFIIPGFGVAGILGIFAFLSGLFLTMTGSALPQSGDVERALIVVTTSLVLMIVGGYLSLRFLPKRSPGGIVLNARLAGASPVGASEMRDIRAVDEPDGEGGYHVHLGSLEGAQGTTVTALHPAGTAVIQGRRIDVVTEGDFIPPGTLIEVVLDEEYRKVVRAIVPQNGVGDPPPAS